MKEYRNGGAWSVQEIESLIPFERDLYILMMEQEIQKMKDRANG